VTLEKAHKTPAALTAKTPRSGLEIRAATRALQHNGRVSECEHLPAGCGVLSAGARGLLVGGLLVSQSCCRQAKSQSFYAWRS
jgi:hypothetical protein